MASVVLLLVARRAWRRAARGRRLSVARACSGSASRSRAPRRSRSRCCGCARRRSSSAAAPPRPRRCWRATSPGSASARRSAGAASGRPVRRYGAARARRRARRALVARGLSLARRPTARRRGSDGGGAAGASSRSAIATLPATLCLGATLPALGQALVDDGDARAPRRLALRAQHARRRARHRARRLRLAGGDRRARELRRGRADERARRRDGARSSPPSRATHAGAAQHVARRPRRSGPTSARQRLRAACASSRAAGALGLGLEVLWTRLFAQVLHNSVYSFTAVALVFLLALALRRRRCRRCSCVASTPRELAAGALASRRVATIAGFWLFVRSTDGPRLRRHAGRARRVRRSHRRPRGRHRRARRRSRPASCCRRCGPRGARRRRGAPARRPDGGEHVRRDRRRARGGLRRRADCSAPRRHAARGRRLRRRSPTWSRPRRGGSGRSLYVVVLGRRRRRSAARAARQPAPRRETLRALHEGPAASSAWSTSAATCSSGSTTTTCSAAAPRRPTSAASVCCRCCCIPIRTGSLFIGLATGITASAAPALGVDGHDGRRARARGRDGGARPLRAPGTATCSTRPDVRLVLDDGRRYLPRATRALRRHRLRPLHSVARRRRQSLRARDVRDRGAPARARRPLLPVAAALSADARGVRRDRAHVPRRLSRT